MEDLGKLDKVGIRTLWPNEAGDFTPWLAENIDLLGEALGMDLEVEQTEASVGTYSLDILARDVGGNRPVVIENQLEQTDHTHLGQLLTYAAGFEAQVVVWIAQEFRDEHRAALDWLNQHTGEDASFFGIEVEAWRIGDSKPAPRFEVKAYPNGWQRQVAARRRSGARQRSPQRERYYRFSQDLADALHEHHGYPKRQVGSGSMTQFRSSLTQVPYRAGFLDGAPVVEVYFDRNDKESNKEAFDAVANRRSEVDSQIPYELDWQRLDDYRHSRVCLLGEGSFDDEERHEEFRDWMIERLLKFKEVFEPYLKTVKDELG